MARIKNANIFESKYFVFLAVLASWRFKIISVFRRTRGIF